MMGDLIITIQLLLVQYSMNQISFLFWFCFGFLIAFFFSSSYLQNVSWYILYMSLRTSSPSPNTRKKHDETRWNTKSTLSVDTKKIIFSHLNNPINSTTINHINNNTIIKLWYLNQPTPKTLIYRFPLERQI